MEPIMFPPWRVATLAFLVIAIPLQAQHRNRKSHDEDRDNYEVTLDTTFAFSRSGSVDLQSFSGDITVNAWDRDEVKIHAKSRNGIRFDASSSRVSLAENPGDHDDDRDDSDRDYKFEISVPKSARLVVRSISGDLQVSDVGDVEAHTVSGDLNAMNIASHADLETISGDLSVENAAAGMRASSVSGDIQARKIRGDVSAQSVSGDVVLQDVTSAFVRSETVSGELHFSGPVDPKGRYEFHSHSGDVDLDLTGGAGNASLDVETYSGDLDTRCAMTLQPGGRGDRTGKRGTLTMGNGGGAHFVLRTFSGDLHIRGCGSHGDQ
jgi:putative adhesin